VIPSRFAFLQGQVARCLPPGDAGDVLALMEIAADEGGVEHAPLSDEQVIALFRAGNAIRALLYQQPRAFELEIHRT